MYKYFIVYYLKKNKIFGIGNCNCKKDLKITDIKDIREIEVSIKENNNFDEVTILNYILLNKEKENGR